MLDPKMKDWIDNASYEALLGKWRFAAAGSPWFVGDTGTYYAKRMNDLRALPGGDDEHVRSSKHIGWE